MLLSEMNSKLDDIASTLMDAIDQEGLERFFKDPDTIKKHLKLDDAEIQELNNESAVFCKQKDWKHALASLTWLSFLEPLNPSHFLRLGAILLMNQEYEGAFEVLASGYSLDPQNPEFTLYMGNCLSALGDKTSAQEFFKKTLELSKNNRAHAHIFKIASKSA
jgi:tetratricopeptide (TPR) repeat protein